jgi:Protein of unknown function (DUF3987)
MHETAAETARFLDSLYAGSQGDSWLVLSWPDPDLSGNGTNPPMLSAWYRWDQRWLALRRIAGLSPTHDMSLNLGLRCPTCRPGRTKRGTKADVRSIPGLWIDVDHSGGVHTASNLPSREELVGFLQGMPFAWSLLIDTGGGVHGYLLFDEPWIFADREDAARAEALLGNFQYTIRCWGQERGWHIDSTADLTRVLRPPGIYNHKSEPRHVVTILSENGPRYTPSDLETASWLMHAPRPSRSRDDDDHEAPPAHLEPMVNGCAWLRHCRDDAATLTEPEWYALLSILGRSEDGDDLAHQWSQTYPGYTAEETDAKLNHALGAGPRTCGNIATLTGNRYCRACPSWGTIKSPIRLGYGRPRHERHTSEDGDAQDESTSPPWPALDAAALHGLTGDIVEAIAPHTEADPVALLVQTLIFFGNAIGRGPHCLVEADYHALNESAVLVGTTAKARKGTSEGHVRRLYQRVDPTWTDTRIEGGLSSGEGLIWAVRDAVERNGEIVEAGVLDKRLLVIEAEFASTLRVLGRDGNTLSAIIRHAWDGRRLSTITKNSPAHATGAHISIIGHITRDELLRYLGMTEANNGFGNRFLWVCVRRANILPEGGALEDSALTDLIMRLRHAVDAAARAHEIRRDDAARAIWREVYPELSEGTPGLLGAMTSRAEAHVMRLSAIYALLDESPVVTPAHLQAALALWQYCEDSARFIFGDALGEPLADEILRALRTHADGMTRNELMDYFDRHKSSGQIQQALKLLEEQGLATRQRVETAGRPREVWRSVRTAR